MGQRVYAQNAGILVFLVVADASGVYWTDLF